MLRLAVAHKDEVVELWQSPERSSEGWHQLVAYPGRITEQFQVRQCWYLGTWALSLEAGTRGAGRCSETWPGQLMPSSSSHHSSSSP